MRLEHFMTKMLKKRSILVIGNTLLHSKHSLSQCLTSGNLHFKRGKDHHYICLHFTRNESSN